MKKTNSAPVHVTHLFFDMDGTLVDTEKILFSTVKSLYSQLGIDIDEQDEENLRGKKWELALRPLFDRYDHLKRFGEIFEVFLARAMDAYFLALGKGVPLIPGAKAALEEFSKHYPLILVTGSVRREADRILKSTGLWSLFSHVLCAEDYAQSKPSPDGYLLGMKLSGAVAESSLVFEDSPSGRESAKRSGARCVIIGELVKGDWNFQDFSEQSGQWVEWVRSLGK